MLLIFNSIRSISTRFRERTLNSDICKLPFLHHHMGVVYPFLLLKFKGCLSKIFNRSTASFPEYHVIFLIPGKADENRFAKNAAL